MHNVQHVLFHVFTHKPLLNQAFRTKIQSWSYQKTALAPNSECKNPHLQAEIGGVRDSAGGRSSPPAWHASSATLAMKSVASSPRSSPPALQMSSTDTWTREAQRVLQLFERAPSPCVMPSSSTRAAVSSPLLHRCWRWCESRLVLQQESHLHTLMYQLQLYAFTERQKEELMTILSVVSMRLLRSCSKRSIGVGALRAEIEANLQLSRR